MQPRDTAGVHCRLSISAAIDITIDRLVLDARVVSMVGCLICLRCPMKIFTRLVACLALAHRFFVFEITIFLKLII